MSRQSELEVRVATALRYAGIKHDGVAATAAYCDDLPNDRAYVSMYGESAASLTFDRLVALTVQLGTTDISFEWEHGFRGSECTPPESDNFTMVIRWKP